MSASEPAGFTAEEAALTARIGLVDQHNDFATTILTRRFAGDVDSLRTYWLPRFRAGGVAVVVAPIWISDSYLPEGALRRAMQMIDGLYQEVDANQDAFGLAVTIDEIERLNAAGRIAVVLSFEGAEPLGQDLSGLRLFHRLGLRMLSFTWMRRTAFAGGTWESDADGGLSRLGRAAVREMNRLGVIVDVSHASDQATLDVLDLSDAPVVASHSNARAVLDHPRNLTDEMIRRIAAGGGVIGMVCVYRFVADEPTMDRWVNHAEHIAEVAGIDHLAVGADFAQHLHDAGALAGIAEWNPEAGRVRRAFTEMTGPEDFPKLTAALLRRGFSEDDVRRVLRDNALRVMREVWSRGRA